MSAVKTFTISGAAYNVARASAVQQDEVLSILTQALVVKLADAAQKGVDSSDDLIFTTMMSLPYQVKEKLDSLLMTRITISGNQSFIGISDFDGKVMDFNRLRAQVLKWNLDDFFTYWAEEINGAIEAGKSQAI